jgi:antitoxin component YwqK of YwqJK toxin-antitoxin module
VEVDEFEMSLEQEFYANGQKRLEFTLSNGKYEYWYESGNKMYKCFYTDGKRVGRYEAWYENGQKSCECTYSDGKLNGRYEAWYENGQKRYDWTYSDGKFHGKYQEWDEQGKLIKNEYYE